MQKLAQLIKLQDYVSRYEQHLTKYTNHYLRLKKRRWEDYIADLATDGPVSDHVLATRRSQFLNDIFRHQLVWASSTVFQKSLLSDRYEHDQQLQFLTAKLPDSYLLFYETIFQIEHALIEVEAIVVTPTKIYCLAFLDEQENDIYQARSDRYWIRLRDGKETTIVSPLLSLQRSETIIRRLVRSLATPLPIEKVIVVKSGYVEGFQASSRMDCHDRRTFNEWMRRFVNDPSPIKHEQMKVTRILLDHVKTESVYR